jgi:hypothetical protein
MKLMKPAHLLVTIRRLEVVAGCQGEKKSRGFKRALDGVVKEGIPVHPFCVAPDREMGHSPAFAKPAVKGFFKNIHPPRTIANTIIVVMGIADEDIVFVPGHLGHNRSPLVAVVWDRDELPGFETGN